MPRVPGQIPYGAYHGTLLWVNHGQSRTGRDWSGVALARTGPSRPVWPWCPVPITYGISPGTLSWTYKLPDFLKSQTNFLIELTVDLSRRSPTILKTQRCFLIWEFRPEQTFSFVFCWRTCFWQWRAAHFEARHVNQTSGRALINLFSPAGARYVMTSLLNVTSRDRCSFVVLMKLRLLGFSGETVLLYTSALAKILARWMSLGITSKVPVSKASKVQTRSKV